jgi:hypothetical protein
MEIIRMIIDKDVLKLLSSEKPQKTRKNKYNNKTITVDGVFYHSTNEYRRECELKNQQRAGIIKDLERQITFSFDVDGVHICNYILDFRYTISERDIVVHEDFKGAITDVFRIKSNLMKACYGIDVWANKKVNAHCGLEYPQ